MIDHRNVLITGCTRGIGKAITEVLLQQQYEVWGIGRAPESPIDHESFHYSRVDLADCQQISAFAEEVSGVKWYAIINNAGILIPEKEALDRQILSDTLQVNLLAPVSLTEALIHQVEPGGKVILISSNWGTFSDAHFDTQQPAYKISKTALNMYGKLLAERLRSRAVHVYNVDPGWVKTDMGGPAAIREPKEVASDVLDFLTEDRPSGKMWSNMQAREW